MPILKIPYWYALLRTKDASMILYYPEFNKTIDYTEGNIQQYAVENIVPIAREYVSIGNKTLPTVMDIYETKAKIKRKLNEMLCKFPEDIIDYGQIFLSLRR